MSTTSREDGEKAPGVEEIESVSSGSEVRKWHNHVWDSWGKPPEERRLLVKIDTVLIVMSWLGHFIKRLDATNINSAFVSGMKEDLHLYGDQLNYMTTAWTVGSVLGEVPGTMLLTRVRPSIVLPAAEITWTILTFATARCESAYQIYIIRFFVGLTESVVFPGQQFVLGSWYKKEELAKRTSIFTTAAGIAAMVSGYLMAGVYNLDGVKGLRGWQWLFIVDGVISLPVALAGIFLLPDVPETTRAFYLTKDERALAVQRMNEAGRRGRSRFTKAKIVRVVTSWHVWLFVLAYTLYLNGAAAAMEPIFTQFLKASTHPKYTVQQINDYGTTSGAVSVVATIIFGWVSDGPLRGRRWPPIIWALLSNILVYVPLAVWTIPTGFKWFCYIFAGIGSSVTALFFSWANEVCSDDSEERAFVIGMMTQTAFAVQAWLTLLVWQQVDAPEYRKGYITSSCFAAALIGVVLVIRYLHKREILSKRGRLSLEP